MTITDIINLTGLVLNIIGSIILAFSLDNFYTALHGSLAIHDMQIKSITNHENRVLSADVANLLTAGSKSGRSRTKLGLAVLIIGFIIQLIPFILSALHIS
jgi:putative exporter of polyketide antibiotics